MLNKSFPTELLSSAHSRKNLRNGIGYTSHEVAESQTGRRFSINKKHIIPETRERDGITAAEGLGSLKGTWKQGGSASTGSRTTENVFAEEATPRKKGELPSFSFSFYIIAHLLSVQLSPLWGQLLRTLDGRGTKKPEGKLWITAEYIWLLESNVWPCVSLWDFGLSSPSRSWWKQISTITSR